MGDLKRHKAMIHCIDVVWHDYPELGCEYKAKMKSSIKQHRAHVHDIDVTWHVCPEPNCSYKSEQKSKIKLHRADVHSIGVTWYTCTELGCEYKVKQEGHLKQHRVMVHDIDLLWWFCDSEGCEHRAKTNSHITTHKANKHKIGAPIATMSTFSTPPRPRPPPLALPKGFHSSGQLATPSNLATFEALAKNVIPTPNFTALSYNVWMSHDNQLARHVNLIKYLHATLPSVIILQEVQPVLAETCRTVMGGRYFVSPFTYRYGNLTLVRKDVAEGEPTWREVEFTTLMGRSGLVASFVTKTAKKFVIGNVHLESLNSKKVRRQQMGEMRDGLNGIVADLKMIGGDFNLDDRQVWGAWKKTKMGFEASSASSESESPPTALENVSVEEELHPTYSDCWLALDQDGVDGAVRYTYDGARNELVKDRNEQMRYDRWLVSREQGAEYLEGIEVVREPEVSDHFGLKATFKF